MHTRTIRRPLRPGLSALLLAVFAVLVPMTPAQAHDRLVSSDPESGATLDTAPEEVSLTFSAAVQDIGGSVDLVDADGSPVEVGSPTTEGTTVTTEITDDLAAGDYEVRWRVVSSDGHPISGVVDFTVEGEASSTESSSSTSSSTTPPESESTTSTPTDTASASPDATEESASSEEDSGTPWGLVLGGVAAVVIVLGAVLALLRSRRRGDA